jgi:predicted SAM-dependent methyltransferase
MGVQTLTLFNIGCGGDYHEGFVNIDRSVISPRGKRVKIDLVFELGEKWPYNEKEFVDGIVGMHVLQQLSWRELITCLREAYRVLKKGGGMRFGCPMAEMEEYDLDYLLGGNNINLFNEDLLRMGFIRIGFGKFHRREFGESALPILATVDNRKDRGTWYFEAIK